MFELDLHFVLFDSHNHSISNHLHQHNPRETPGVPSLRIALWQERSTTHLPPYYQDVPVFRECGPWKVDRLLVLLKVALEPPILDVE